IIGGYPDGSFKSEGNITRAEVTKMICVALNGGKNPAVSTNTTPTFSDVRNNANAAWAEGYIESCAAQGIVSGVGGGKFAPAGNVTGTQLAKMLLVSLGYKADVQNFTGNAWATNVNVLATQKGLYKGLESMDPAAALTRDNAAQMIWNALQAKEVEYKYTLVTENGNLTSKVTVEDKQVNGNTITLLADKYEAEDDFEGTLVSYKWDDKDKEFDYEVLVTDADVAADAGVTVGNAYKFSTATDYTDLFGLNVKVIYKTNKDKDVYGIFANDSAILAQGVVDDLDTYDNDTIKFDGVKYDTDANIALAVLPVVAENQWPTTTTGNVTKYTATISTKYNTLNATAKAYTAKLIDVDNDGEADYVVYLPFSVAKVNSVGSKTVALTDGQMGAPTSLKFDDDTIYSGIAKDDYVKIVATANSAYDGYTVTKLDAVKGIVTGTKSDQIQVEGKWYTVSSDTNCNISISSTLNNEYTFYVVGSFAYYSDSVSVSLTNVLFVFDTDKGLSDQAKVYFTDGTSSTVTVKEVQDDNGKEWGSTSSSVQTPAEFGENGNVAGKLYTYTVKNNEYTLKEIGDNNDLGYTWDGDIEDANAVISAAKDNKAGKLDDYAIADDAVVFIQYKENGKDKVKVVTGATAKDYKNAVGGETGDAAAVLYKTTNGVDTAQVAMLITSKAGKLPSSKGESDNYGYVVADAYGAKIDGDDYTKFTIWNGSKDVEVYTDDSDAASLKKGAVIKYSDVGNGEIDDVVVLTKKDGTGGISSSTTEYSGVVAIKGISGKTLVTAPYGKTTNGITTTEYYLTKDTVYLYVDTENNKGEDTGAVNTAIEETKTVGSTTTTYYKGNACIYVDSLTDKEITLIVVDTSNDWDGLTY
ncbi:MAG: S-layer homology domain-containing protein, partial [Firmicutes bacterium]|nr:S-layer homology domain-containing protein [Bacillota bacterium]